MAEVLGLPVCGLAGVFVSCSCANRVAAPIRLSDMIHFNPIGLILFIVFVFIVRKVSLFPDFLPATFHHFANKFRLRIRCPVRLVLFIFNVFC